MENIKIIRFLEFLSLILNLSYIFIHSIYFVLTGVTLSLYLINIKSINSLIRSIIKYLFLNKISKNSNKNNKTIISDTKKIKSNKEDSKLSLVETIEELGFIPSIDKNNDSNAA